MSEAIYKLNTLLDEVGARDGLSGLRLDANGTGGLALQNGMRIFLEYVESKNRFYLYTPLMDIPQDDVRRLNMYEAMLSCNFLGLGYDKGSLGISRETAQAVYQIGLNVEHLSADQLDDAIDALIDWRDEVKYQLEQFRLQKQQPLQGAPVAASTLNRLVQQTPRR